MGKAEITIQKVKRGNCRSCNCCGVHGEDSNIYELYLGSSPYGHGIVVALCGQCLDKVGKTISKVKGGKGNGQKRADGKKNNGAS